MRARQGFANGGDADTVDGSHAAAFAPAAQGVTNGDLHDHIGSDGNPITEGAITLVDVVTNDVSITKHGLAPKAPNDATKFLNGTGVYAVPAGGATDKDIHYFRQIGTTFERWYVAGMINQSSWTTGALVANIMRAVPFISGRGGTLDRIAMNVSTGVAGNARIGIYDSTSDTNLYPNALIVDSGVIDVTTAEVKSVIISTVLDPNKLYWFVVLSDVAPTLRGMNGGSISAVMGITSAIGVTMDMFLSVSQTYGALPATFPAGGGMNAGGVTPAIAVRYSA